MGKRVAVVLSGSGPGDGSEIGEAVLVQHALERAGCEVIWAAPDVEQPVVHDHARGEHARGERDPAAPARKVLAESARIARGRIRPLASLEVKDFDALVFPGGGGIGSVLSNYTEKAERCEVLPDVARLLKAALAAHRPMGFIGVAPILAARVLGPVAGVHITLGPRGTAAAKHAAVMGADVRPGPANEIFIDRKNRVVSTPTYMYEETRLTEIAHAIERLVRTLLQLRQDGRQEGRQEPRQPSGRSPSQPSQPAQGPQQRQPGRDRIAGRDPGRSQAGRGGDERNARRESGPNPSRPVSQPQTQSALRGATAPILRRSPTRGPGSA